MCKLRLQLVKQGKIDYYGPLSYMGMSSGFSLLHGSL